MTQQHSNRMIKNGLAAMIVALIAGFFLIFCMIKGISFSPLPFFLDVTIPGTPAGWRAVHVGTLLNGLMAILLGVVMRTTDLEEGKAAIVSWGTIFAIWSNFGFYLFGMFAPNHGLTMGTNAMGEGNWAGVVAFLPALIGAVTLLTAVIIMFQSSLVASSTTAK